MSVIVVVVVVVIVVIFLIVACIVLLRRRKKQQTNTHDSSKVNTVQPDSKRHVLEFEQRQQAELEGESNFEPDSARSRTPMKEHEDVPVSTLPDIHQ